MTQLLLFEPTSQVTSTAAMAEAAVDYARTANRAPQAAAAAVQTPAVANQAPQPGMNHMGDLARLVLLRYDILAKRRAEIAGRRAR